MSTSPPRFGFTVGVVIPTVGRPLLQRAVSSVLGQTYPPTRIVLAVDGPAELLDRLALPVDPRIVVVVSPAHSGPSAVRNAGIRALDSDLVALLDDDDEWLPTKLERQVQAYVDARAHGVGHPLISARVLVQDVAGSPLAVAPIDLCQPNQTVGDYLFRRKRIRRREALLLPSTFLVDRELALEVPFDDALSGAEDADWLLRVSARSDTMIVHLHEPLARYTEHRGGRSRNRHWKSSLEWLLAQEGVLSRNEQADAMLCDVAPQALMAHDLRGFLSVLSLARQWKAASWRAWFYITCAVFVYAAADWGMGKKRFVRQLLRRRSSADFGQES